MAAYVSTGAVLRKLNLNKSSQRDLKTGDFVRVTNYKDIETEV
jgi:hypothetical protein